MILQILSNKDRLLFAITSIAFDICSLYKDGKTTNQEQTEVHNGLILNLDKLNLFTNILPVYPEKCPPYKLIGEQTDTCGYFVHRTN